MPRSPERARAAVFKKASKALSHETDELTDRWLAAFRRRTTNRGESFPTDELHDEVVRLVRGVAEVLDDTRTYRRFVSENREAGQRIAEKHVQAGGTLTTALEAYMRLRQALIYASRDEFRDSDRPFFDLMSRLNRIIDRILFAIAEGYFSAFQAEIEQQALTDALTGLGNSRRFREALRVEVNRSDRTGRPFSIVFVDIDDFKTVNDRLGHVEADRTLKAIGDVMASKLRSSDLVCRWGGDEFIVLLPETQRSEASVVAEKLRSAVSTSAECGGVTISLGVACLPEDGSDYDTLVASADRALYASKRDGKNMVTTSREADQWELAL